MMVNYLCNIIIFVAAFSLYGCSERKTHQQIIADVKNILIRYDDCLSNNDGSEFCRYVREDSEDMKLFIELAIHHPQQLGEIILTTQQQIGTLELQLVDNHLDLNQQHKRLSQCYLILRMLSTIG